MASYNDAVAEAVPDEPHWYLGVLATKPERREEGLAIALLGPILEKADRLGIASCLETSTEETAASTNGGASSRQQRSS